MSEEIIISLIDHYTQYGIRIFDGVDYEKIENYLTNFRVDSEVEITDNTTYIIKSFN